MKNGRAVRLAKRLGWRILGPTPYHGHWVWVGDRDPEILVVGQSQRAALLLAYQRQLTQLRVAVLQGKRGRTDAKEKYWHVAATTQASIPIVVAWTGNVSILDFLFVANEPFRVITESRTTVDG